MQEALFLCKHKQPDYRSHRIAQPGCDRCTTDPHLENRKEKIVQYHVQHAAGHRADQGKRRLFACNHVEGELIHQQDGDDKQQISVQVFHTVALDLRRQVDAGKKRPYRQGAEQVHGRPHHNVHQDQEGKVLPRLLCLPFAHLLHNYRAAPCGEHGRNSGHKLYHRCGEVDGRQRVRTDQVGYEQPVNHRIKGHKYRHQDGWNRKPQDVSQCDRPMVSVLIFHGCFPFQLDFPRDMSYHKRYSNCTVKGGIEK